MDQKRIDEAKGMDGKCLICGTKGTEAEPTRRGLCVQHYARFHRWVQRIADANDIRAFEDRLIAECKLLPSRQGQKSADDDPFAEAAAQFLPVGGVMKDAMRAAARLDEREQKAGHPPAPKEIVPKNPQKTIKRKKE
jgi:hypothetical protein